MLWAILASVTGGITSGIRTATDARRITDDFLGMISASVATLE
jgi:hypothetical protein